jgi:ElaB/YqjD/DUF883 family membrane-anchored ribosome-binding protein
VKRLVLLIFLGFFAVTIINSVYAQQPQKGASAQAYEHASEQSVFNRVGDWFATIGKSGAEKEKILQQRRAQREAKRIRKQTNQESEAAQKQLREESRRTKQQTERKVQRLREKVQENTGEQTFGIGRGRGKGSRK